MSGPQLKPEKTAIRSERILDELYELVARVFQSPPEQLTPETDFVADLAADSLDIVELAMEVEEHFRLTVPDEAPEQLKTVRDLADLVGQLREAQPPATN
ncbi:MAG: acyl carrier protein [Planctomycetales bacterium]|nr:acyl carrier protein [Planctomycetales bacterium]NIP85029.1 acyl carrier protein [Planctomycetales bacterium]